jgi:ATP-dependent Clp protease ATP-binding subunit ClpC
MFERFTDSSRAVLTVAQEEARLLNHEFIGTEHLLLGLLHQGDSIGGEALAALGIELEPARHEVTVIVGTGSKVPKGSPPFTPRAKKVLELSLREALQLGHKYIGTEHILLGLTREGEGAAVQVLVKLGVDLEAVRQRVIGLIQGRPGRGGIETPGTAFARRPAMRTVSVHRTPGQERTDPEGSHEVRLLEPHCPGCRADLTTAARFRTVSVPPDPAATGQQPMTTIVVYCSGCGDALHMFRADDGEA